MSLNPGIYIHVPFCLNKCAYCSFYSVSDTSLIEAYVNALTREMDLTDSVTSGFDSIYFGGGTPSILKPAQIETILDKIRHRFSLSPDMEITLEANPGTVNFDDLKTYAKLGVNRINFGVQTFHESVLKRLGRIHSVQEAYKALEYASKAGFKNIGLDIIYGIPGQTETMLKEDIESAIRLKPEHISSYLLSFEEGSLFYQGLMEKKLFPLPEDVSGAMVETVIQTLEKAGYLHYEVSNYARNADYTSRHNRKYWDYSTYLGFGPSAHSFLCQSKKRYWNIPDVNTYIKSLDRDVLPVEGYEHLTREQEMIETVFLGLRKKEGVNLVDFYQTFGVDLAKKADLIITSFMTESCMISDGNTMRLTPRGFRFADHITTEIISVL